MLSSCLNVAKFKKAVTVGGEGADTLQIVYCQVSLKAK